MAPPVQIPSLSVVPPSAAPVDVSAQPQISTTKTRDVLVRPANSIHRSLSAAAPAFFPSPARASVRSRAPTPSNTLVQAALNLFAAQAAVRASASGSSRPSVAKFNMLLKDAVDYSGALNVLGSMQTAGIAADEATLGTLFSFVPSSTAAVQLLRMFSVGPLCISAGMLNVILCRAGHFQEASALLADLLPSVLGLEQRHFLNVLQRATTFDEARHVIEAMHLSSFYGDESLYTALIGMAPDWASALTAKLLMEGEGIVLGTSNYNALLEAAPNFFTAQGLIHEMKQRAILRDSTSYTTLFGLASSMTEAGEVVSSMETEKLPIPPDALERFRPQEVVPPRELDTSFETFNAYIHSTADRPGDEDAMLKVATELGLTFALED